jgi:branched-chain amino acid transport system ATP-binding protein
MLELHGVAAGYAGVTVIHDIDLTVGPREIVALVGNNGAGKSTLVKAISGLLAIRAGTISFEGRRIERWPTAARMRAGIVHVPEGRQIFAGFSTAENLALGGYLHAGARAGDNAADPREEIWQRFPVLRDRAATPGGNLSGGQQQILAIGRGLMARPRLLLLDEPSLGLAPRVVTEVFDLIKELRERGIAILLSEQNANLSLAIADRGYVVENGRVVLSGSGRELLRSREVAERYLGIGSATQDQSAQRRSELAARLRELLRS